jgi:hypothetical protein
MEQLSFTEFADRTWMPPGPRKRGESAAQACAAKAERVSSFSTESAKAFILNWLTTKGQSTGEDITDAAKEAGIRGHDDRCFGPAYAGLARAGLICKAGLAPRRKGHGADGAVIWRAVE